MIAVDTNILVYAHRQRSDFHEPAAEALRTLSEGNAPWAIPWPCCYEFLSVVTNRRIWRDAASEPGQAWRQLVGWAESPSNRLIGETPGLPRNSKSIRPASTRRWRGRSRCPHRRDLRCPWCRDATHPGPRLFIVSRVTGPRPSRRAVGICHAAGTIGRHASPLSPDL